MNKYVKEFLHRGLIFAGFGPIILGIVFGILEGTVDGFALGGGEVFVAVLSTYAIAFVQAGASVFNQVEHWSLAKSLFFHFGSIYLVYVGSYLANTWIPFEPLAVLIFTAIFAVAYFVVWVTVYLIVRGCEKKLNARV